MDSKPLLRLQCLGDILEWQIFYSTFRELPQTWTRGGLSMRAVSSQNANTPRSLCYRVRSCNAIRRSLGRSLPSCEFVSLEEQIDL